MYITRNVPFYVQKNILKLLVQIYVVVYLLIQFFLIGPILRSKIDHALSLYHIYSNNDTIDNIIYSYY